MTWLGSIIDLQVIVTIENMVHRYNNAIHRPIYVRLLTYNLRLPYESSGSSRGSSNLPTSETPSAAFKFLEGCTVQLARNESEIINVLSFRVALDIQPR